MRVGRRDFLQGMVATSAAAALGRCGDPRRETFEETSSGVPHMPAASYFAQLQSELAAYGSPQMLLDLDRLDANADAIVGAIGADRYRMLDKSLPSLELLRYIQARTGSNKILAMHLPFAPMLMRTFPDAQLLVGKPHPVAAAKALFLETDPSDVRARVTFLVDTTARLHEYAELSRGVGHRLRVALEVDIGLHRGGFPSPEAFASALTAITELSAEVELVGMLGYDGHIVEGLASGENAVRAQFNSAMDRYQRFVDRLREDFPSLWREDLILNSGGTNSYPLFTRGPANDVATGGGMLRPASYASPMIGALRPATFIASPVLASLDDDRLPLLGNLATSVFAGRHLFTLYGGFLGDYVWPAGLTPAPLVSGAPEHQVPNQGWMTAAARLEPGNWVFQHPHHGDAIFQFEDILLVRDGRLTGEVWKAFTRRF